MNAEKIAEIVKKQRAFFESGATLPVSMRKEMLKKLRAEIVRSEKEIAAAIAADLGKSAFESYMCETGLVLSEIAHMRKHIRAYAGEKTVTTPLPQFASRSFVKPAPYGTVLIMSPWNYPFLLTIGPLVDAVAAGNTVVLKPSAYSPATSEVMRRVIEKVFPPAHVCVITGGREENACLLEEKFDYIFFTGSKTVGRLVLEKAAPHLTPVTLELGGKSPCIVDKSANIELAAKRIVFGKFLNCGQTCVAPDYILCEASVKEKLTACLLSEIEKQYGKDCLHNKDYGRIVNRKHFDRICGLMDADKVVCGGNAEEDALKIEPTIMTNVTFSDKVMQEEIFGPVLPIVTFETLRGAIEEIGKLDTPLALYMFSSDKKAIETVLAACRFGGGCVNDTIIHLATTYMGFGGMGESGMGAYHGKVGFQTFSHQKSIVDKKTWLDLPMRYQPYKRFYGRLLRMFLR